MAKQPRKNENLVTARRERKWTQKVVSERVGVDPNTYYRWEAGTQEPHLTDLDMLCQVFGCPADELGFAHLIKKGLRHAVQPHQDDNVVRRNALVELMVNTLTLLNLIPPEKIASSSSEEVLFHCSTGINACHHLYLAGDMQSVKKGLPQYLSALVPQVEQPSRYQKNARSMASQAHLIMTKVALQERNFNAALGHSREAAQYGLLVGDRILHVAALVWKASTYFYHECPQGVLRSYQEALQHIEHPSPLLYGRIHAGLAEAYAKLGREQEALTSLGLALDIYPEHPEEHSSFLYTHFLYYNLFLYEGLTRLNLKQPKKAWEAFAHVAKLLPAVTDSRQVDLLCYQTMAAVAMRDLEQSCSCLETLVTSALQIDSPLSYVRAQAIYWHIRDLWWYQPKVKALAVIFVNFKNK